MIIFKIKQIKSEKNKFMKVFHSTFSNNFKNQLFNLNFKWFNIKILFYDAH